MTADWFWEGNVVASVVSHLEENGWTIKSIADTEGRAAGVDIRAERAGNLLLVEAKGYPSRVYARGENKGMPKPTNPATQARHWYSQVLFAAILRQSQQPGAMVAIALPDFRAFTNLVNRTRPALLKLDIGVYLVRETGSVESIALAASH
jgi:hypothetical protein